MPLPPSNLLQGQRSRGEASSGPVRPVVCYGAAEIGDILGRLRSEEGQYQLIDTGATVAGRRRQAFLRRSGYCKGRDKAVVEDPYCRLAAAQPFDRGGHL